MKTKLTVILLFITFIDFSLFSQDVKSSFMFSGFGGSLPSSAVQLKSDTEVVSDAENEFQADTGEIEEIVSNEDTDNQVDQSEQDELAKKKRRKKAWIITGSIVGGLVVIAATTVGVLYAIDQAGSCADSCSKDCSNGCNDAGSQFGAECGDSLSDSCNKKTLLTIAENGLSIFPVFVP